ncbi:MAG: serine hydrolase [Candidatus Pacebacteria bacterium]|nr:serine hydrolase [Candidatus Paceibacterota bacterium]MBP9866559.1 serine hydrolase [Candidatus Paceibacterota bacterium]
MKQNISFFKKYIERKYMFSAVVVIAGIFLSLLVWTYFFYIPKIVVHTNNSNTLLNPALSVLDKKDLIVNFQELREYLTNTYEKRDDYLVSIYFEYLPTGANISINKDEKIWPASLIKIPVAMSAMKKVENKIWKIDNELVILDDDKDSEYGDMYKEHTGSTHTIQKFLEKTLIDSDNTAHFVLLRNLDGSELEDVYTHLGLDDVIDSLKKSPKKENEIDNRITAKKYSIFFRSLYNATYLDQAYSQMFLDILEKAPRDLLGAGLPESIPFVHKTGIRVDEGVRADSGIVYAEGRPYIITVMVQKKNGKMNEDEVVSLFKDISEKVYYYVTKSH